jgi:hypothetical protein
VTLQALNDRLHLPNNPRVRRAAIATVVALTLIGCTYEHALLLQTVELYYRTGGFDRDLAVAVDFAEKVLGSGMVP